MHTYCTMCGNLDILVRPVNHDTVAIDLRDDDGNTHVVYAEAGAILAIALTVFRAAGMPDAQADRWAAMLQLGGELNQEFGERQDLGDVQEDRERGDVDPDCDGGGDQRRVDVEPAGERVDALAVEGDDF